MRKALASGGDVPTQQIITKVLETIKKDSSSGLYVMFEEPCPSCVLSRLALHLSFEKLGSQCDHVEHHQHARLSIEENDTSRLK